MKWGLDGLWGSESFWGLDTGSGPEDFCAIAQDRVLVQMDDAPGNRRFRDLICIFVGPDGHYRDVCIDILGAFDIDTAVGDQLDILGAILDQPRQGFADDRYRVHLRIKRDILLSVSRGDANWTGTHNNILAICREFMGAAAPPIILIPVYPYSFNLTVPTITAAEAVILAGFICLALYAGVYGFTSFQLANDSLWASQHGAVADSGLWASQHGAVAGSGTWGHAIGIGQGSCP
jgi:hypothetical protein